MDGRERARELRRVPLAALASAALADHEHGRATQSRAQTTHPRGHALSQRSLAATIGDRRADGNQRRMGDRKTLRDLRNQVRPPYVIQALLQKERNGIYKATVMGT